VAVAGGRADVAGVVGVVRTVDVAAAGVRHDLLDPPEEAVMLVAGEGLVVAAGIPDGDEAVRGVADVPSTGRRRASLSRAKPRLKSALSRIIS